MAFRKRPAAFHRSGLPLHRLAACRSIVLVPLQFADRLQTRLLSSRLVCTAIAEVMPASDREIKARLGAVRLALGGLPEGQRHQQLSKLQSIALADQIKGMDLDPATAVTIAELLTEIKWAEGDLDRVLAVLQPKEHKESTRRKQQNFQQILNYFTDGQWTMLLSSDVPPTNKLHELLLQACRLGMRCPSEHTTKWIASIWMHLSKSQQELARMDVSQKLVLLMHVKATLKGLLKSFCEPVNWIDTLPDSPATYIKNWPLAYRAAMAGDPVVPRIDLHAAVALNLSFGCRGGHTRIAPVELSHTQQIPSRQPSDPAAMMMEMFSKFMERMVPREQSFFAPPMPQLEHVIKPVQTSHRMALHDFTPRRMDSTGLSSSNSSEPGRVDDVAVESSGSPDRDTGGASSSSGSDLPGHLTSLLKAIDDRKDSKSQKPASTPKKRPAAADAAAELTLGCSKCRWSSTGCGTCRNPAFGGLRWNSAG